LALPRFADELEEAVLLFSREGRLLGTNRAARHLFGEGVKPGASPIEASLNYAFSEAVEEALAGKRAERETLLLPAERWVKVVALPGEEVWVVVRDLTPERRLLEMRDRFLVQAAHELRTPVGAIAGWAETLEDLSPEEVGEQRELLGHIRREAQRLGRLVEDLLQLSRLRGREVTLLRRECDLGRLAREAAERFMERFGATG
jgi:two-component system phosphate regulon sensor histidine kinase PhoR